MKQNCIYSIFPGFLPLTCAWLLLVLLTACEEGDADKLAQTVRLADLEIESIEVSPVNGTIKTGYSYQFNAYGVKQDGSKVNITKNVNWTSGDSSLVSVNSKGLVSTHGDGSVAIMASLATLQGSTQLTTSSEPLEGIAVTMDGPQPSDCRNVQMKAVGTYADGVRNTIPITNFVTWSVESTALTSDGEVPNGSISTTGFLSTYTNGTVSVRATLIDDVNGEIKNDPDFPVDTLADLVSVSVSPVSQTINRNSRLEYTATGTYSNGSTVNITDNLIWDSLGNLTADFISSEKNVITAKSVGIVEVEASCGDITNSVSLTVVDETFESIEIRDDTTDDPISVIELSISSGIRLHFKVFAKYSNAEQDITFDDNLNVNYVGSASLIVTLDQTTSNAFIIVTPIQLGEATIKAEFLDNNDEVLDTELLVIQVVP